MSLFRRLRACGYFAGAFMLGAISLRAMIEIREIRTGWTETATAWRTVELRNGYFEVPIAKLAEKAQGRTDIDPAIFADIADARQKVDQPSSLPAFDQNQQSLILAATDLLHAAGAAPGFGEEGLRGWAASSLDSVVATRAAYNDAAANYRYHVMAGPDRLIVGAWRWAAEALRLVHVDLDPPPPADQVELLAAGGGERASAPTVCDKDEPDVC